MASGDDLTRRCRRETGRHLHPSESVVACSVAGVEVGDAWGRLDHAVGLVEHAAHALQGQQRGCLVKDRSKVVHPTLPVDLGEGARWGATSSPATLPGPVRRWSCRLKQPNAQFAASWDRLPHLQAQQLCTPHSPSTPVAKSLKGKSLGEKKGNFLVKV